MSTERIKILKPIAKGANRLGLEKEGFKRMPGTVCNWVPTKKGDVWLTGLEEKKDVREKLEKALGVSLSNTSDYYKTMNVRIEEKPNGQSFNVSVAKEAVQVHAMLASATIANGEAEYHSGKKPYADWFFENEDSDARESEERRNVITAAIQGYEGLSNIKKANICKILGINVFGLKPKVINEKLWMYIECLDTPGSKKANCTTFLDVVALTDDQIDIRALVKDAVDLNVIRKNSENDFVYGDIILGTTRDQVVGKVSKDDELRKIFYEKVEDKMRSI